jgi:hypothetical protein
MINWLQITISRFKKNSPRLTHIFNDISDNLLGGWISHYRLVWISRDPLLKDNYQMNDLVLIVI